ncbi:MAG: Cu2+-exporting ATPase [Candidatus Promineifilaceae bacterium]|jgi:Cu2+-exporting ATPase
MKTHAQHESHSAADEPVDHQAMDHSQHQDHSNHPKGGEDHSGHGGHAGHEIMFRDRFWVSLALSIPVLIFSPTLQNWLSYTAPQFPGSAWITPIISVVIFVYGGIPFLQMATTELQNRKPGMMTLISLAISVAFLYSVATLFWSLGESFFWELVTLIDIMLLGHWLEMRSVRQASGALDALAQLMPDTAERISNTADEEVETVSISDLRNDDIVLVRPGASVPADGEVAGGSTEINEAMITGESKPVLKSLGDKVLGGTVNSGDSSLRVRVTALGDETALSGIMRLVKEAQESKSDTQILADRAAAFLFYAALAAAVLTGVIWTIAIGWDIEVLKRVVTVLIIACPHALGLAVPLVVAITTAMGARNGILVRDRLALEEIRNVDVIIFDKTGTLTKGEFGVANIATADGVDEAEMLALAAAIEGDSEHLLARAIRSAAEERNLTLPKISNFEIMKGRGVRATHNENTVYVGGPRLLEYLATDLPQNLSRFSDDAGDKGQSVIYLIINDQLQAAFALADVIRPESYEAVGELHKLGISVAMLTGDSQEVAKAVADELGIDQYLGEVLPEDKDTQVKEMQAQGRIVAMVGDGVNDAPALSRADVGIAIGGGTDVAVESAGLILVRSNPLDVVKMVKLSNASHRKMRQNIWWAAGYNIIAIPLAAGVLAPWGFNLPPAVGAIVMSLSTIVVAINAQLLRREQL